MVRSPFQSTMFVVRRKGSLEDRRRRVGDDDSQGRWGLPLETDMTWVEPVTKESTRN